MNLEQQYYGNYKQLFKTSELLPLEILAIENFRLQEVNLSKKQRENLSNKKRDYYEQLLITNISKPTEKLKQEILLYGIQ